MFDGFARRQVEVEQARVNFVIGGRGHPVLLLHGYPQTHVCWHRVAPVLSNQFTVVCSDLRGYGDSSKPPGEEEHRTYSKRAMAADQVQLMQALGFNDFAVVGHDRGARVARRMAIDYPDNISKLALLDIVPTKTVFGTIDQRVAISDFHWFFLVQPDTLPEQLIAGNRKFYLDWILKHWCATEGALTDAAKAEYRRCFDVETIMASCEDYRAGATIDLVHDAADEAQPITCPLLLLWSARGTGALYDVMEVWKQQASDVRGIALDCGHFIAEEKAAQTASAIIAFLS